jgi:hypothetical protein
VYGLCEKTPHYLGYWLVEVVVQEVIESNQTGTLATWQENLQLEE